MKLNTSVQSCPESFQHLLRQIPVREVAGRSHSELTLGTAQLGMKYGITNRTGKPARSVAVSLVRRAIGCGVMHLDTARGYGESEAVLGEALQGLQSSVEVITKLDPLVALPADADAATARDAVNQSVARSRSELRTDFLPVLLLHRWQHRTLWNGAVWHRLLELQSEGIIGRLGVSIYEPEEAMEALDDPKIQYLQLPMNLLDWRWRAAKIDQVISRRTDLVVHARSAFLQGVLLQPSEIWPTAEYDAKNCVRQLQEISSRFGRAGLADLCLAYLRGLPWITSIVTGCETIEQLDHTVSLFRFPALSKEQCNELQHVLPEAPVALLNPSQWKIT